MVEEELDETGMWLDIIMETEMLHVNASAHYMPKVKNS